MMNAWTDGLTQRQGDAITLIFIFVSLIMAALFGWRE